MWQTGLQYKEYDCQQFWQLFRCCCFPLTPTLPLCKHIWPAPSPQGEAQPSSHPQLPASNPLPAQVSMNTSDDMTQDKVSSQPSSFLRQWSVQTRNFPIQFTTQLQRDLGWPREGSSIWVENRINIVVAVQLYFSWRHDQTSPFTFSGMFNPTILGTTKSEKLNLQGNQLTFSRFSGKTSIWWFKQPWSDCIH